MIKKKISFIFNIFFKEKRKQQKEQIETFLFVFNDSTSAYTDDRVPVKNWFSFVDMKLLNNSNGYREHTYIHNILIHVVALINNVQHIDL